MPLDVRQAAGQTLPVLNVCEQSFVILITLPTLNARWLHLGSNFCAAHKNTQQDMVYVTVTKYSDDFIMVETPEVAKYDGPNTSSNVLRRDHRSIHTITVDLEEQGYSLTSTCGNTDMLVLVFHKEGIVEVALEVQEKKEKKDKRK
jgi:hypothetical protein